MHRITCKTRVSTLIFTMLWCDQCFSAGTVSNEAQKQIALVIEDFREKISPFDAFYRLNALFPDCPDEILKRIIAVSLHYNICFEFVASNGICLSLYYTILYSHAMIIILCALYVQIMYFSCHIFLYMTWGGVEVKDFI